MNEKELLQKAQEYISFEKDEFFKNQVAQLITNKDFEQLNDRFYTNLEFGTGGLRGLIGGGYNRMNPLVVRKATQGLATYVKNNVKGSHSAVIGYDSRNFSDVFALEAALILCANGFKTYLFSSLRPTPEISFAVRHLKTSIGIVVTASHNPPEYNGYKVSWSDGAQVVPPHDTGIIKEVLAVTGEMPFMSKQDAIDKGLLVYIDKEVDRAFIDMVKNLSLRPQLIKERGKDLKVVYTPLHGTGAMPVDTALREVGINCTFVPEQQKPDGNFPTVNYPNPEEASAMKLALELAKKTNADLVIGTDPDADRIGTAAPENGDFRLITGNQLGALLADYVLSTRKELGTLPKKAAFIKTIVTTELQRAIAEEYGVMCIDTLTGFKYIGEKIRDFESDPNGPTYILGGEESYGYLIGTSVRDKDAVGTALVTAEMTLYHLSQGRTLLDQLKNIWKKHGYYEEVQVSKHFQGEQGLAVMKSLMEKIRKTPPKSIADQTVEIMRDFKDGTTLYLKDNSRKKDIDLPSSNVIQFVLADKTVITARPSGTEPKIKFYASCRSLPGMPLENAIESVRTKIQQVQASLRAMADGV